MNGNDRSLCAFACVLIFFSDIALANLTHLDPLRFLVAAGAITMLALIAAYPFLSPWVVLGFAVAAGVTARFYYLTTIGTSDVLRATAEALGALGQGENPYAHYYLLTTPQGSPFVYLPGELAFYAIQSHFIGWWTNDRLSGILVVLAIAAFAPLCGAAKAALATAFYGSYELAAFNAVDGSNDTALAFLVVTAALTFAYAVRASGTGDGRAALVLHVSSAMLFGWALAFKELAWFAFPFFARVVARQHRRLYVTVAFGVAFAFCAPLLVMDPGAFVRAAVASVTFHQTVWGFNLWSALQVAVPDSAQWIPDWVAPTAITGTVVAALALWAARPRALGEALLQGAVVLATTLVLTRWTTLTYFSYLSAIVSVAFCTWTVACEEEQR